jgi:hypothetical protein
MKDVKMREIFNFATYFLREKFNKNSFIPSPTLERKNIPTSNSLLVRDVVKINVHASNKVVENKPRNIRVRHFSLSKSSLESFSFAKINLGSIKKYFESITVVGIKNRSPEK